jgi:hypothetical protein
LADSVPVQFPETTPFRFWWSYSVIFHRILSAMSVVPLHATLLFVMGFQKHAKKSA